MAKTRIKFLGAAGTVTGSCYRLDTKNGPMLVECGMFQGSKTLQELNYGGFPFDVSRLQAVLLTHAHIDHSGLIPKLYKHGYNGPVYCTQGTKDLLTYMLPDSGFIQETEVKRLNARNLRRHRPTVEPIYTRMDAEACLSRIETVELCEWFEPMEGVKARFWNAGHILGSASIELLLPPERRKDRPLKMVFAGDIGPQEKAFHDDPSAPNDIDYLVTESTYGDRERGDMSPDARRKVLKTEVMDAIARGGNLIIPAFAVERTQELLFDLGQLMEDGLVPHVPVYLDSPLAIKATEVFEKHGQELADANSHRRPFRHPGFRFLRRAEESMELASVTSGAIIIAAAGMCIAGRVRYHLKNNLWRSKATVLLVGYQAPGTLGALLESGAERVRIHGQEIAVNATIRKIEVYSAHADASELAAWIEKRQPVARGIFLTHGEPEAISSLMERVSDGGYPVEKVFIPRLDEVFDLPIDGCPKGRVRGARLSKDSLTQTDWHNEYADLTISINHKLHSITNDRSKMKLLKKIRKVLD